MWKYLLVVILLVSSVSAYDEARILIVTGRGTSSNGTTTINNITNNITTTIYNNTVSNYTLSNTSFACNDADSYIYNYSILNGIATGVCAADTDTDTWNTTSQMVAATGWFNDSVNTSTNHDVRVYGTTYLKDGNGQIVSTPGGMSLLIQDDTGTGGHISFGANSAAIGISRDGLHEGYDYDGAFIFKQQGTNPTEYGEFIWLEENMNWRFALPKSLAGLGTYNPRSLIVAGPSVNNVSNFNCSYWGFTMLDCATSVTGADLGVQDDLQVLGQIYGNLNASYVQNSPWWSYTDAVVQNTSIWSAINLRALQTDLISVANNLQANVSSVNASLNSMWTTDGSLVTTNLDVVMSGVTPEFRLQDTTASENDWSFLVDTNIFYAKNLDATRGSFRIRGTDNIDKFTADLGSNITTINNSLRITNLTAASCDIKADTNGLLYCGTDATGSATVENLFQNKTYEILTDYDINLSTGYLHANKQLNFNAKPIIDNAADGYAVTFYRNASEGQDYFKFYIDNFRTSQIQSNRDLIVETTSGGIELHSLAAGNVNLFRYSASGENRELSLYGYVDAARKINLSITPSGVFKISGDTQIKQITSDYTINATGLTDRTLTAASCDVKSYTNGTLYCGTDATGAASGLSRLEYATRNRLTVSTISTTQLLAQFNLSASTNYTILCDFLAISAATTTGTRLNTSCGAIVPTELNITILGRTSATAMSSGSNNTCGAAVFTTGVWSAAYPTETKAIIRANTNGNALQLNITFGAEVAAATHILNGAYCRAVQTS